MRFETKIAIAFVALGLANLGWAAFAWKKKWKFMAIRAVLFAVGAFVAAATMFYLGIRAEAQGSGLEGP